MIQQGAFETVVLFSRPKRLLQHVLWISNLLSTHATIVLLFGGRARASVIGKPSGVILGALKSSFISQHIE